MNKTALVSGIIFAATAVILGAFGAHALKKVLEPEALQTFEVGVKYQMYHAFALIAAGILAQYFPGKMIGIATICFITGVLLFSGSLYAITLFKMKGTVGIGGWGMLTPLGGLFFILGWIMLLISLFKK